MSLVCSLRERRKVVSRTKGVNIGTARDQLLDDGSPVFERSRVQQGPAVLPVSKVRVAPAGKVVDDRLIGARIEEAIELVPQRRINRADRQMVRHEIPVAHRFA